MFGFKINLITIIGDHNVVNNDVTIPNINPTPLLNQTNQKHSYIAYSNPFGNKSSENLEEYLESELKISSDQLQFTLLHEELERMRDSDEMEYFCVLLGIFVASKRIQISNNLTRAVPAANDLAKYEQVLIEYLANTSTRHIRISSDALIFSLIHLFIFYHEFDFLLNSKKKQEFFLEQVKRFRLVEDSKHSFDFQSISTFLWRRQYAPGIGKTELSAPSAFCRQFEDKLAPGSLSSCYLNLGWLRFLANYPGFNDYFDKGFEYALPNTRTHDDLVVAKYYTQGKMSDMKDIDTENYKALIERILVPDGRRYSFIGGKHEHDTMIKKIQKSQKYGSGPWYFMRK